MDARLFEQRMNDSLVRRFTNLDMDLAIQRALKDIDPGTKAVSLDVDFDSEGVRGVLAFKEPGGWSIALIGELKRERGLVGGVQLRKEWK